MNEKKIENIRERITGPPSLVISRVPRNTFERFKSFASLDEFSSDYGMALKHLLDFYMGIIPTGTETLETEIEELKTRITHLEQKGVEKKKVITACNGKIITERS